METAMNYLPTGFLILTCHFGFLWRFPLTTRSQTSVSRSPLPVPRFSNICLREVVPRGGSTIPSTDVIQLTLTLQMIIARQSMSMQQSYLILRQPSDDHAHPTYRST